VSCGFRPSPSQGGSPAFPFVGSSEGRGVDKTLGRCLKGEGLTGAVEVAIATCSRNGWPSLKYHGDVRDGTLKDLGSCGERTCRRCSFVDRRLVEARTRRI
jgi:hypothetical protein